MSRFNSKHIANFIRYDKAKVRLLDENIKFEVASPLQVDNDRKEVKTKDLSELVNLYNQRNIIDFSDDLVDFVNNYPSDKYFFLFSGTIAYSAAKFTADCIEESSKYSRAAKIYPIRNFTITGVNKEYNCYFLDQFVDNDLRKIINASKPKQENSKPAKKHEKYDPEARAKLKEQAIQKKYESDCKKIEAEINLYGKVVNKDLKDKKYAEFTAKCLAEFREKQRIEFAYDKDSFVPKIRRTQYKLADSLANENIVGTIELIERVPGANRHNKHKFDSNGVVRKFAYKTKTGFNIIELCVFYCETCGKYFDYIESYKAQLGNANIDIETIAAKHVKPSGEVIHFGQIFDWSKESVLKKFGYSVGYGGPKKHIRQRILSFLISSEIMTLKEVKQYLEMFININGRKSGNEAAKADWENDLKFVNEYRIKNNPYK